MRPLAALLAFTAPFAAAADPQCHGRPAWDEPVVARTGPRADSDPSFDAVRAHFDAGRYNEALRALEHANRAVANGENSEVLMWLGRIHVRERRFGAAYACFAAAHAAWGMQVFEQRPGDAPFRQFFEVHGAHHEIDAPDGPTAVQTIERLEREDADEYFEMMHGNAHPLLQRLMVLRYGATADVIAAIDRLERDGGNAALVVALYRVLAFVKDPASIPWLTRKLDGPDAAKIHERIVRDWQSNVSGAGHGTSKWLTGHEQWVAFWVARFRAASSEDQRAQSLDVLGSFDHADAVRFFTAHRAKTREPFEAIIVETYLHLHDVPLDASRLAKALATSATDDTGTDYLIALADEVRHEVFVPFLINKLYFVEPYRVPVHHPAHDALVAITCVENVSGAEGWRTWFAAHGHEGREAWRQRAEAEFRKLLRANEDAAVARFAKTNYIWDDIAWLPLVTELAPRAKFHDRIAGWINLTYTAYLHPRLEPLAHTIAKDPAALDAHTRRLLEGRGFLPDNDTWAAHVRRSNSRL